MTICGNGIWLQEQYTGSALEAICDKFVSSSINLIYMEAGYWNHGRLGIIGESILKSAANTVHTYNTNHNTQIKILGFIMSTIGRAEDISNYNERIADLVSLCKTTGLDGISDDIENFGNASGQTIQNYYEGLTTALHQLSPPRLCTAALPVENGGGMDQFYTVVRMDLMMPMIYFGNMNTFKEFSDRWLSNVQSPVSIAVWPGNQGMNNILRAVDELRSSKLYSKFAGISIWSYDASGMSMTTSDWSIWNAWSGKNISGCETSYGCVVPSCSLKII